MRENSSSDLPAVGGGLCRAIARLAAVACVVALAVVALGIGYFAVAGSRMAFLRGATLVLDAAPESYELAAPAQVTDEPLKVVTSIPAPPMDTPWWSPVAIVDPDSLVRYTLREGGGNCAAKSRGLGWWLHSHEVPYRLVYLFSDPGIRHGEGHTMLETTWQRDGKAVVSILDPLAAGIPVADGVPVDSDRLIRDRGGPSVSYWPARPDLDALKLRVLQQTPGQGALQNSIVGLSPGSEVNAHLRFMKRLSAIFPDSFFFRAAGMSASLFLGIYPKTYVPPDESSHVSGLLRADMFVARSVVWGARAGLALGLVAAVAWIGSRVSKGRSGSSTVPVAS